MRRVLHSSGGAWQKQNPSRQSSFKMMTRNRTGDPLPYFFGIRHAIIHKVLLLLFGYVLRLSTRRHPLRLRRPQIHTIAPQMDVTYFVRVREHYLWRTHLRVGWSISSWCLRLVGWVVRHLELDEKRFLALGAFCTNPRNLFSLLVYLHSSRAQNVGNKSDSIYKH